MPPKKPAADTLLARHWLSHPGESAYQAAKHMGLQPRTIQKAAERLRGSIGSSDSALFQHLLDHPIPARKTINFRHPNPERWLARTRFPLLMSGEDAAVIDGWDLMPRRHLAYVDFDDLDGVATEIIAGGGRLVDSESANMVIRVGDEWLIEDPRGFVERGQRLADYMSSGNVQFLIQLRERIGGG